MPGRCGNLQKQPVLQIKMPPQQLIVDTNAKYTSLIYNHGMANAENVTDVNSLILEDFVNTKFTLIILY